MGVDMADIEGKAIKFGDNINTDIISPPQYMDLSIEESARYAMSAVEPLFYEKVKTQNILVAGSNFGSGSSRETSPLTLKYLGVRAVVAKFFARIFYRNAINVGLLVIECGETDRIRDEDEIRIDYREGKITNVSRGETYVCSTIPEHLMRLIEAGGLKEYLKKEMKK